MSFYQASKTMKAAVIGTIMPWSGALSEIPDGWIICDGQKKEAKDYPLLVQVIGDTYNEAVNSGNAVSSLGGAFPNYSGLFQLPDLLGGRMLMDIEQDYFTPTGKINPIDQDSDAGNLIAPFIGSNVDNGVPSVFNNVYTDVEFELNDRLGYSGAITGNDIIDGQGEKAVFVAGRKLGHQHIRNHTHPGVYETIQNNNKQRPGLGVVPYDNITAVFTYASWDETAFADVGLVDTIRIGLQWRKIVGSLDSQVWADLNTVYSGPGADDIILTGFGNFDHSQLQNFSGFGNGSPGRSVMVVRSENPPLNLSPQLVRQSSIAEFAEYDYQTLSSGDIIPYGIFGTNLEIPVGLRNYYPDEPAVGDFQTLVSNVGSDWLDTGSTAIQAHAHDPFSVIYDQNSLKPQSRLTSSVNIPINTVLDNATNVGALQINMNTSQPSVSCIYLIRAY